MVKVIGFQKVKPGDKDFESSETPYRSKNVQLEVVCDKVVIESIDLELTKYIGNGVVEEHLQIRKRLENILFNIEMIEILDDS